MSETRTLAEQNLDVLTFFDQFEALRVASRRVWRAVLAAAFGLDPKDDMAKSIVLALMGRTVWPTAPAPEVWIMAGRRAGKSITAAFIALYLAICKEYKKLAPGEVATIMVIAADRKQARAILRYARGLLLSNKFTADMIRHETQESLELTTGVVIEIHTASFRSTRGYTCVAVLCDEIAFWRSEESSNPDTEILGAIRPALATTGGPLICIGSGYAKRGELYAAYKSFFRKDGCAELFFKGTSRTFNPELPQSVVDRAYEKDPAAARSEYGGEFREDVEAFLTEASLDLVIIEGRKLLPHIPGTSYRAFIDFAGGGGADSAALAIGHTEMRAIKNSNTKKIIQVLDFIVERRPPFSPEHICAEFAGIIKGYGLTTAAADRWGGLFPVEEMKKSGVHVTLAEKAKSDLYKDFLPSVMSKQAELLDDPRMRAQLLNLERRTGRGGRDSIDHPPGGHDDVANVCAGVISSGIARAGIRVRRL